MVIDLHSHYFPLEAAAQPGAPVTLAEGGETPRLLVGGHAMSLNAGLFDLGRQRDDLQRQGLARRVLAPPPFTILYELPPAEGLRWSRSLNDAMARAQGQDPERFIGFATVPLQDPGAAAEELERAASQLGLPGVEILTSVNGLGLDAPSLDPFWRTAERLALPILVHPHYVAGAERMGDYHLRNLVGNPAETALAGARLLFGGVVERFPGMKLILSHGGGALPHLVGRLRQGYAVRPEARARASDPLAGLTRLYYDTIVFDPTVLRHLVELVGASRVVVGTDYPFDMSEALPVELVRAAGLSQDEQRSEE
ncbi:MAG TPA: amidohydrolase family protein, partial [Thermomicrobiaceae bacterium]|nr:amidohydrolase family protein [Thermomicrobiaceae bacterium]